MLADGTVYRIRGVKGRAPAGLGTEGDDRSSSQAVDRSLATAIHAFEFLPAGLTTA